MKTTHQYSLHGGVANNQWKGWHGAGKGRRRNGLIIIIYISHYLNLTLPLPFPLKQQLPPWFQTFVPGFQVVYHQPTYSEIIKFKIWKGPLRSFPAIPILDYELQWQEWKFGQILGSKSHYISFSNIQNLHTHYKRFLILAEQVTHLILSGPSSSKINWAKNCISWSGHNLRTPGELCFPLAWVSLL